MIHLDFSSLGPKKSRLCSKYLNRGKFGVPKGITATFCFSEGKPVRSEIQNSSNPIKLLQTTVPIRYFFKLQNRWFIQAAKRDLRQFYRVFFPGSNEPYSLRYGRSS